MGKTSGSKWIAEAAFCKTMADSILANTNIAHAKRVVPFLCQNKRDPSKISNFGTTTVFLFFVWVQWFLRGCFAARLCSRSSCANREAQWA